ncbi:MAG: pilus assembly protein PilM [Candidatus Vogelbacteria bacterium]|nr:pilus assembly protein PilM [Candidatus Vogelbacteria bacterium]
MRSPNLFLKLFPPPKYLEQPALGLDLSDRSIKFCQLSLGWRGLRVARFGERPLELGIIEAGQIKNRAKLESVLREIGRDIGVSSVVASLPEEPAYIVKLELPPMRRSELRESLELQLEEHVSLAPSDAIFDYEILNPNRVEKEPWQMTVSVVPRDLAQAYQAVLQAAGLEPVSFEIEAQAMARAVIHRGDRGTAIIVDFGKTRTSFFVSSGGQVVFTSTTANISGEAISRSIQKNLNTDYPTAEQLKRERGLLSSPSENKLLPAVVPLVAALRDEINKVSNYWQQQQPIQKIILCGGQVAMPGLVEYLSLSLKVEVGLGNIWTNILDPEQITPPIAAQAAPGYAVAMGLGLKHFRHFELPHD